MRRGLLFLVVFTLVTAACSGGDTGEEERALADAIRKRILTDDDPDLPFGEAEAKCLGETVVAEFGVEALAELGITRDSPGTGDAFDRASDEDRNRIIDITLECVDVAQLLIDLTAANIDLSPGSETCLHDELSRGDFLERFVRAGVTDDRAAIPPDGELVGTVFQSFADCLTTAELQELGG